MKSELFQQDMKTVLSQRNKIAFVCGIQTVSMAILILGLVCKSERIILMPPEIKKEMCFQGGIASPSYLEEMGTHIAKLLLDITPASFPHNHAALLKYATPEAYGTLKNQLFHDGEQYTQLQLSTHFYPTELIANPKTLEVQVKGTLTSYVAGHKVRDSQETLTIKFTYRGATLLLESVSGGNPHAS